MNDRHNTSDNTSGLNCNDVRDRLGDYVEGDMSPHERQLVDDHLDSCVECTGFLASYKHVIELAAELKEPEQEITVDVQNRLRATLNQRLGIKLPMIA